MAAIGSSNASAKQAKAAENAAKFRAEQVRLKEEAAKRRAAAATREGNGGKAAASGRPWASGHGGGRQGQR